MYSMKINFDSCKEEDLNNFMNKMTNDDIGVQTEDNNVYLMFPNKLLYSIIKKIPDNAIVHF